MAKPTSQTSPSPAWLKFIEPLTVSTVITAMVVIAILTFQDFRRLQSNRIMVWNSFEVLQKIDATLIALIDAETGQRGYLITGREDYLEPYRGAETRIAIAANELGQLTSDNRDQQANMLLVQTNIAKKLGELEFTITTRSQAGFDAARAAVDSDLGMRTMEKIRAHLGDMRKLENEVLATRQLAAQQSYRNGMATAILSSFIGLALVGGMVYLLQRNRRRAEQHALAIFTEREQLRVTLESIGDGMISTDAQGCVTYLNPVSAALTGWTTAEAKGQRLETIFKIVNEETHQTVDNPAVRSLREGAIVGSAQHILLIGKNGTETPVDDSAAPIRDSAGQITGAVLVFRDVSQRREEERRLSNAASFTRSIIDALSEMVIVLDRRTRILAMNRSAGEAFGAMDATALGISIDRLNAETFARADVQELLAATLTDEAPTQRLVVEQSLPDGSKRVLRLEMTRFDPHLEQRGSVLLVISDLSDERALQEKHTRLDLHTRWFLEQISDYAIFTMDRQCRASSWNQGVKQVLGYEEDEFIGQDIRQLIFTPEAIASGSAAEEFAIAARTGEANDDRWMMRKGGVRFWASGISNAIHNDQGELVGFSKIMRDLTDRKKAMEELDATVAQLRTTEERLRLALDAAEMGAWNIDPVDNELITDARFRAIFGVTDEEIDYQRAFSIVHPDDREQVRARIAAATNPDNPAPYSIEYRVVHPDLSIHWVDAKGAAHFQEVAGVRKLVSFDGTVADVTQRRMREDALRKMAADLSEADRRKNEFLATLAHELRNPLAPIKNAVQLMAMTELDGDTEDLRQTMARQVEQLVHLIDDLLDVSRISRGKITLRREVVDVASIVAAAVEASSTFISESGQRLTVHCPEEPVLIYADPARITQITCNLLNNSAKYSSAGCQIDLSVSREDSHAVIRVCDNGIGIDSDRLEDIFQMFSQVNDSLERGSAGLGIGLTLVKTLVELHGGTVAAESAGKGLGSQFTVRLPLTDRALESTAAPGVVLTEPTRAFRILIVEDQRALRVVLTRLLQKMGHEVETAESGQEALTKLSVFTPEIIFSDISMPGMTGYELVTRLRALKELASVYFVAMTGYGQASDREKALETGFDEHIVKPVDVEQLKKLFCRLSQ